LRSISQYFQYIKLEVVIAGNAVKRPETNKTAVYTEKVGGSKPSSPTNKINSLSRVRAGGPKNFRGERDSVRTDS
jgi:hypothetical protein